jgi:hypothetical protein
MRDLYSLTALICCLAAPIAAAQVNGQAGQGNKTICDTVLGAPKNKPESSGEIPTLVCLRLQITDTGKIPVQGVGNEGQIDVKVKVFAQDKILANVDKFKSVPNRPGLFAGRLPIDDDDERYLFSVVVGAPGFLTVALPPRKFSRQDISPDVVRVVLPRNLQAWQPQFEYGEVPDQLNTLWASDLMFLSLKGNAKRIPDFKGKLDRFSLDDSNEFVLAKAASLNLFYVLHDVSACSDCGDSPNWLGQIRKIVAIGQERIIAKVDSQMLTAVEQRIDTILDPYSCIRDREANASLHGKNFSGYYTAVFGDDAKKVRQAKVISLKAPECRGNLQITVGEFLLPNGVSETLADIDFDDDFDFVPHMTDVVDHWIFARGTNPMLVYEYLKSLKPDANLGYDLRRKHST